MFWDFGDPGSWHSPQRKDGSFKPFFFFFFFVKSKYLFGICFETSPSLGKVEKNVNYVTMLFSSALGTLKAIVWIVQWLVCNFLWILPNNLKNPLVQVCRETLLLLLAVESGRKKLFAWLSVREKLLHNG